MAPLAPTRLPEIHNNPSKIQLERIAHVYFEHSDLDAFDAFATDFGLVEAYRDQDNILYRGYGVDAYCYVATRAKTESPAFQGAAWVAQTQEDFDKAAALSGAVITDLSPFPGGGRKVTLKSPSGFLIHIIYGQEDRAPAEGAVSAQVESIGPSNGSLSKRRLGKALSVT